MSLISYTIFEGFHERLKYLDEVALTHLYSIILPGHHLCSFDTLRLPDNANSFLRIVQVVQQHTNGIVPVSGTAIGL